MAEADMREVVRRLHAENSEAALELLEFDYALEEILRVLESLAIASQELHSAVRDVATDDESFARTSAAQERAGRLHATVSQLLAAFRQFRDGVKGWDIAVARRRSSVPSRGGDPAPK